MANQLWDDWFMTLGNKYVDWFLAGKFQVENIVKFACVREVLVEVYTILVKTKQLAKIDDLQLDDKNTLWNDCKPYIERLSTKERIKFCKCYWALSCLVERRKL